MEVAAGEEGTEGTEEEKEEEEEEDSGQSKAPPMKEADALAMTCQKGRAATQGGGGGRARDRG